MFKDGKIEKTLKPSERKSITEFSSRFGTGPTYEEKARSKRFFYAVFITFGILVLILLGYFITDVIIGISELPYMPQAAEITYGAIKWISSPIIQG